MQSSNSLLGKARKTLIGNRAFYAMVLAIVVPMIIQNAITNFVNLLDNIMVGKIGTDQMTGVSIANQLLFVANLCVFGGMSGAGIFSAQFHGAGSRDGVQNCFRYKIYLAVLLSTVAICVFSALDETLISLYLNEIDSLERSARTLGFGMGYLHIMLWGFPPFAFSQAYASTLRETGETRLPMVASITGVLLNLVLNFTLIYGHFGAPAMGVRGAALATVISRYVELTIMVAATHAHPDRFPFIHRIYHTMRLPLGLAKQITVKGMPLLLNEALWSLGTAMLSRCYSLRGLDVVAAMNISSTVSNLFGVVFLTMGNATAIIIGQALGSGEIEYAKEQTWKLAFFAILCSLGTAAVMSICAPFIPQIYNTEEHIRALATRLLLVYCCCMPIFSFCNTCYFTLRSGGKTLITFMFDCVFSWTISIPIAYSLVMFTSLSIVPIYLCVQLADLIKCTIGFILVKKGIWIQNMVAE